MYDPIKSVNSSPLPSQDLTCDPLLFDQKQYNSLAGYHAKISQRLR